jgi:hypothetical protein
VHALSFFSCSLWSRVGQSRRLSHRWQTWQQQCGSCAVQLRVWKRGLVTWLGRGRSGCNQCCCSGAAAAGSEAGDKVAVVYWRCWWGLCSCWQWWRGKWHGGNSLSRGVVCISVLMVAVIIESLLHWLFVWSVCLHQFRPCAAMSMVQCSLSGCVSSPKPLVLLFFLYLPHPSLLSGSLT